MIPLVCIPSLGRPKNRTAKMLDQHGINFLLFVEEHEYEQYVNLWGEERVKSLGGRDYGCAAYARNAIVDYARDQGFRCVWMMDDDIKCLYKRVKHKLVRVDPHEPLNYGSEFIERYGNLATFGYPANTWARFAKYPHQINRMNYGCYLVSTEHPFRYTPRTADDLDYCLQILTGGWCTWLNNEYAFDMIAMQSQSGGYTDIRANGGDLRRKRAVVAKWPMLDLVRKDTTNLDWRVDSGKIWRTFKHRPILRYGKNGPKQNQAEPE